MRNPTENISIRSLLKKITASGLASLLLVAGLPPTVVAAESCRGWNTAKFFKSATVDEVRACLSAGRGPDELDRQGLTVLHRAARDTSDPAVIEALLDAGANPRTSSRAGRLPRYYARKNDKIKGSDAYQRLRVVTAQAKKRKKADWSRVQAVPHHRKSVVQLYKDAAPPESRRIKGRFDSATADSITLMLKDGQTRTVQKQAVRKVLIFRPFGKRWQGWVALAVLVAFFESHEAVTGELDRRGHAIVNLPIATGVFFASWKKGVYNVPPKHRMLSQADRPPVAQGDASGKQEDLSQD